MSSQLDRPQSTRVRWGESDARGHRDEKRGAHLGQAFLYMLASCLLGKRQAARDRAKALRETSVMATKRTNAVNLADKVTPDISTPRETRGSVRSCARQDIGLYLSRQAMQRSDGQVRASSTAAAATRQGRQRPAGLDSGTSAVRPRLRRALHFTDLAFGPVCR